MKFSTNIKRLIFSALFFCISIFILFTNMDIFLIDDDPILYNEAYIGWSALFITLTSILLLFKFELNSKINKVFTIILFILTPISTFFTIELFNNTNIFLASSAPHFTNLLLLLNFLIIFVFTFILFAITNSFKVSGILTNLTFNTLSIINYFVTLFRGQPLVPWDIYSVATAVSVAGSYKPEFTPLFVLGIFTIIFTIILISKFNYKFKLSKKNIIIRIFVAIISIILIILFYTLNVIEIFKINVGLWAPANEYRRNGFLVSFFKQSRNLFMPKPEGYSVSYLKNKYGNASSDLKMPKNAPNIIAIMNESFTDFSVLGDVETNEEYMTFYNSITDNCIKGNLHVSVYGGGTPNTEWEFLTGNTMAFLPQGSVPYQQYLHKNVQSIVKATSFLDYTNYAMHSYYKNGYRRSSVYPLLGFSDFFDITRIEDLMTYVRCVPSDYGTYLNILEKLNNKEENRPQFSFTITMQNHGSYAYDGEDFDSSINFQNLSKEYPYARQFVNLMAYSDESLKYLIEQIEEFDEPTIILFFGDHQPKVETEFVYEILSQHENPDSLIVQEKKYVTPFMIWANYDIEEENVEDISANYLSTLLFETANLPLTPYMQFLSDLRKEIPVITANCYIDKNGIYHTFDEVNEYTEFLKEYEYLEYNNVFDTSNTIKNIFYFK